MTPRPSLRRGLLATLLCFNAALLAACTTTVTAFEDDGGTGAGASGSGASGSTGGSGGGGAECSGFEDTTTVTTVTVTVQNATAQAIYLGGTDCEIDIDLRLFDAADQPVRFRDGVCHFTCSELQVTDAVCAAGCALPPIVMIAPGGSYELTFNGTMLDPVEMPTSCYFNADFATGTCDQRVVAPTGGYAFAVTGYDDSWCPLDQPGACECTPNASGNCTVEQFGDILSGQGVEARASFNFPSDDTVELVFD